MTGATSTRLMKFTCGVKVVAKRASLARYTEHNEISYILSDGLMNAVFNNWWMHNQLSTSSYGVDMPVRDVCTCTICDEGMMLAVA